MAKLSAQGLEIGRVEIDDTLYAIFENRWILRKFRYDEGRRWSAWTRYNRVRKGAELTDFWKRFVAARQTAAKQS